MDQPVSQKECSKCGDVKPLEDFPRDARARDGRRADCKTCNKAKAARYRDAHPEECRERVRHCADANREQYLEQRRHHYAENRDEASERNRAYREANSEQIRANQREYREDALRAVFDHYGHVCTCCGSTENLTIDHVNGGGTAHRLEVLGNGKVAGWVFYRWLIENGFPGGFQVLCFPCNQSKGTRERCGLNHEDRVA